MYFAAAKLALPLAIPPGYASPVWPASGIALAALLLGGHYLWPAVWLGSFAANLTIEASLLASGVIATGSALQALAAGALVRRFVGERRQFGRADEVFKFVAVSALAALIAPTCALPVLALEHPVGRLELLRNWWTWWQGDATGMIVVAPLILSWAGRSTVRWTREKVI